MSLPLTLTRRGWGVAFLALLGGAGWFAIELRDLLYLAAFLAALVILSAAVALVIPGVARLRVHLTASTSIPTVGETFHVLALVRSHVPRIPLEMTWQIGQTRMTSRVRTTSQQAQSSLTWKAGRRGPLRIAVASTVYIDPLGLAKRRVRAHASIDLLVLPRLLSLPSSFACEKGHMREEDGWVHLHSATSSTGLPGGAVREYRSGDAPRTIHWKQSARQGTLLVNVADAPEKAEKTLVLVTDPRAYASEEDFELAVAGGATIATRWLQRGYRIRLFMGGSQAAVMTQEDALMRAFALVTLATTSLSRSHSSFYADATGTDPDSLLAEVPPLSSTVLHTQTPKDGLPRISAGDTIVTGMLTPDLLAVMPASRGGGTIVLTDSAPPHHLLAEWDYLHLPPIDFAPTETSRTDKSSGGPLRAGRPTWVKKT